MCISHFIYTQLKSHILFKIWIDPPLPKDVIIALIDPDQMFLRTITTEIKSNPNNIISGKWKQDEIFERVEKGKPVGQTYGLGAPWTNDNHKKFNRKKICGGMYRCISYMLCESKSVHVKQLHLCFLSFFLSVYYACICRWKSLPGCAKRSRG